MERKVNSVRNARVAMRLPRNTEGVWRKRRPAIDWEDEIIAARVRELHDLHRTVADVAREFNVSRDVMKNVYRHLGITPHRSNTNTKESQE
jgi:AraC-like DNA-binding protein